MDVASPVSTRAARDLWRRIEAHAFDNPDIDFDFTHRLARTLGWSVETARAGIAEYRRFCFLACVATRGPVTPSEEVDEIWHLHLTYTRDYWDRWCGQALGRPLHHDPTSGGAAEDARYRAQYAETLALYERWFGPPPAAFWPGINARFGVRPRWQMVDSHASFVLPRPSLRRLRVPGLAGLLASASTPAAAEAWNPLDMTGSAFLTLYLCLVPLAVLLTVLLRDLVRTTRRPANLHGATPAEIGFIAGGYKRAADTVYLQLASAGVARHTDNRVSVGAANGQLSPALEPYRAALHGMAFRTTMIETFRDSAPGVALVAGLRKRNVVLSEARARLLAWVTAAPVALVLLLGVVKIFVGLSRGKPVFFLFVLCVATAIGLVIALRRLRPLTGEGKAAFNLYKSRSDRAIRAPRPAELALAFAVGGAAVLAGTEHAAYGKVVQPQTGGSGCGASGCTSGGGGGSGCGGGGCGGCSGS